MKRARPTRGGDTAQLIGDVCDHFEGLRRYYFDVVSADENEVTVRIQRKAPQQTAGFKPPRR